MNWLPYCLQPGTLMDCEEPYLVSLGLLTPGILGYIEITVAVIVIVILAIWALAVMQGVKAEWDLEDLKDNNVVARSKDLVIRRYERNGR